MCVERMTQDKNREFHLIIAAAGHGDRFGNIVPKQYVNISGKTLLRHTLDNALRWDGLKSLRVIIDPEHAELYHEAVKGLDLAHPITGGISRKSSINNAISSISHVMDNEIILVHDAARPLTPAQDIRKLLAAMETGKAATLASPVTDTLRRDQEIISRDGLWALQTPQAFYFGDLKTAHTNADNDDTHTDDTSLITAAGIEVRLVEGSRSNIKLTTPDDLPVMRALLAANTETRTGMGFDVHAFEKQATGRKLMLCGVAVPHDFALTGHSDADVGLHALTDALLGTIGEGDIGTHFPPSDAAYKDMDSAIFLRHAVSLIDKRGGSILNLDLTLICEAPKIGPHAARMKERIAEIAGINAARISIKATTTEKLGFTGRGEGIAAQAIATVRLTCF